MRKATEGEPQREFPVPANIQFLRVNPVTGQPALPWGPRGMEVALREAQVQRLSPALGGAGRENPLGQ